MEDEKAHLYTNQEGPNGTMKKGAITTETIQVTVSTLLVSSRDINRREQRWNRTHATNRLQHPGA